MSSDFEKAYMDEYAASFFPPEAAADQLPEVFAMRPGALEGEIKAIPQTGLQRIMEQTGLTLQQIGDSLDAIGKVKIGGIEIGLRDLLPFVGDTEERVDPATGEVTTVQTGTPKALEMAGQGVSMTTGTGLARQMRPDVANAAFDVVDVAGIGKAAAVGGKKAVKKATKAMKGMPDTELQGAE